MQENDFDMNQKFMNHIGSMLDCTAQYILDHFTYSKNASEQRKRFDKYSKTIRETYGQMSSAEKMVLDVLVLELNHINTDFPSSQSISIIPSVPQ